MQTAPEADRSAAPTSPATPRPKLTDTLALAAAALAVCVLLGQQSLYNRDAHVLLLRAAEGKLLHDQHFTYGPLLAVALAVCQQLGLSLYESSRLYSAVGIAVGVGFVHLACRGLGQPRATAALTTGLVALCPAVVFFGTVVEVHGPFFAFAGLASAAAARLVAVPRWSSSILLGAAMGLAYCAHASANLLVFVLPPVAFGWLRAQRPDLQTGVLLGLCLVPVAMQAVLVAVTPVVLRAAGAPVSHQGAVIHITLAIADLTAHAGWFADLPRLIAVETAKEWLWPMLPLSVAFALGFRRRELRLRTWLLALGILPYLALAVLLLARFPDNAEHGAYLLPLVWPAALLTTAAWPRRGALALLVLSGALAAFQVTTYDQAERNREYAAGLRAHAGAAPPYLLVGDYLDLEALFVRLPDVPYLFLLDWVPLVPPGGVADLVTKLDALLATKRAAGHRIYLTEGTVAWLELDVVQQRAPAARAVLEHLRSQYRLEAVAERGFRGFAIEPKP